NEHFREEVRHVSWLKLLRGFFHLAPLREPGQIFFSEHDACLDSADAGSDRRVKNLAGWLRGCSGVGEQLSCFVSLCFICLICIRKINKKYLGSSQTVQDDLIEERHLTWVTLWLQCV